MFVVYNDLNIKCGPYTSSNPLQFRDIPWYSAPFFTCWNQTWYAQLNLSHSIPSINMDIFMGNLARQAVALPKGSHQPIFHRLSPLGVTTPARGGLHVHLPVPQPSVETPTPDWDVPRLCQGVQLGQVSWEWFMAETVMVIPPAMGIPYYGYIPVGVWSGSSIWNRVWATWYVSIGIKDSKPLPSFDIPKIYATNCLKEKTRGHQTAQTNLFPVLLLLDFKNRVPQIHISPMQKCRMSGYPASLDKPKSLLVTTF